MKKPKVPLSPKTAAFCLIFIAAAVLRIAGLRWGLPHTYNSDEPHIVNTALAYAASFPRPFDFKYPALWPTILFFCYGVYFVIWSCFGLWHKVGEFVGLYGWHPGGFYLIGRALSVALSLAGPGALAWYELKKLGRSWPWAALCLAFSPTIVEVAHSCKPDCLLLFWSCLAFMVAVEVQREGRRHAVWALGAFIGLAGSTQYSAAPLALLYPSAFLLSMKKPKGRWFFEGLAACAAAFFLTSPYTLIDFPRFMAGMKDFAAFARGTQFDPVWMRRRVAVNAWSFAGDGSIAGLLAVLGLVKLFRRDFKLALVLLLPAFGQWLMVSRYPDGSWSRYLLAAFPGLALLAAQAFDEAAAVGRPLLTLLVSVLAFAPGVLVSAFNDAQMRLPDTRPSAAQWIEGNVPAGSSILLDAPHASPELVMEKTEVDELAEKTKAAGSPRARLYRGMAESHPGGGYRLYRLRRFAKEMEALPAQVEVSQADYPLVDARPGLDTLKALRIKWVVTSNWGADPSRVPELRTFFDELYGQAELVRDFTPAADERGGPVLRIFKLR